MGIKRIFVTKKAGFDVEAKMLLADLKDNLMIKGLSDIILYNRYDILGLSDEDFNKAKD
ncbi:MAG: phosphoribosylformylglycinamidine synthase, partial [Clostridiaceae bacterium]|nr:phosphoribosylformylglycinamidine synthase [Clostridiaceae bacterium]